MAVSSSRVTVEATVTGLFVPAATDPLAAGAVLVKNAGGASIYLGGPTVTAATGTELASGEIITLDLRWDDKLYGITAAGTVVCHVLKLHV